MSQGDCVCGFAGDDRTTAPSIIIPVVLDLGVVHNCHHFHERTQRTLGGGEGVKGDRTLF